MKTLIIITMLLITTPVHAVTLKQSLHKATAEKTAHFVADIVYKAVEFPVRIALKTLTFPFKQMEKVRK